MCCKGRGFESRHSLLDILVVKIVMFAKHENKQKEARVCPIFLKKDDIITYNGGSIKYPSSTPQSNKSCKMLSKWLNFITPGHTGRELQSYTV